MWQGGETVHFGTYKIGPKRSDVLLHLYVVPRKDRLPGGTFTLALFMREKGKLKRLNSVQFIEGANVDEVATLWLEPKRQRGPIIVLHFSLGDGDESVLFVFPKGLTGEPTVQVFGWTLDGEHCRSPRFDRVDKRGFLLIREEWDDGRKSPTPVYKWDGVEFKDSSRPYFVIAATVKIRTAATEFIRKHKLNLHESEIRPSGHYPKLTAGYYIVILERFKSQKEATKIAAEYQKDGITCYVKRAF